jgi:hypothetical protein
MHMSGVWHTSVGLIGYSFQLLNLKLISYSIILILNF